jgi:hypothetical protein
MTTCIQKVLTVPNNEQDFPEHLQSTFYVLYVSQNKQRDLIGFHNRDIARLLAVRTGSLNIIRIHFNLYSEI